MTSLSVAPAEPGHTALGAAAGSSTVSANMPPPPCCTTGGCSRETWNGQPGQTCCRSCLHSGGTMHGPECDQKWAARQASVADAWRRLEGLRDDPAQQPPSYPPSPTRANVVPFGEAPTLRHQCDPVADSTMPMPPPGVAVGDGSGAHTPKESIATPCRTPRPETPDDSMLDDIADEGMAHENTGARALEVRPTNRIQSEKRWEVQTDQGWTPWAPSTVAFTGTPGEEISFDIGRFKYKAVFDTAESGRQINVQTGKSRPLRLMECTLATV